jgi:uncharacterized protein YejL (UPF0352 family)
MRRFIVALAGIGLAAVAASSALAQPTVAETTSQSCTSSLHSVYYARGESTASREAVTLIGHIGAQAAACEPEGIDLLTAIDVEGEHGAVQLALARLGNVASELIASGVPAERIRLAARPAGSFASPMGEVSIIIRKTISGPDIAAVPAPPIQAQTAADSI